MIDLGNIPNRKTYTQEDRALRFLLGGIGTGNVSLTSAGELCDFEIFNHQGKGDKLPYSFFALWAQYGKEKKSLVLEARPTGLCDEPMGVAPTKVPGLPRFDQSTFTSAYPFAQVDLQKDGFPFAVSLQAYNPMIPLNEKDSSIPAIRLTYWIRNDSGLPADLSVAGSMPNACGVSGITHDGRDKMYLMDKVHNEIVRDGGAVGIFYRTELDPEAIQTGTMALLAEEDGGEVTTKSRWLDEGWWDGAEDFWRDFSEDGRLREAETSNRPRSRVNASNEEAAIGSLAVRKHLEPGETADFVFLFSWHFPNRYGWWPDGHEDRATSFCNKKFKTWYSTCWKDALAAAGYLRAHQQELETASETFAKTLFSSTVDPAFIDAAASNITVLRSPTCFRIADGTFFGWEGSFYQAGSCPGTCTHVWNYAQTLANLFPELEKTVRRTEFLEETDEEGRMMFRAKRHLGDTPWDMYPAVDGQMGCILRVYREWKMTGDDAFLKELWPSVLRALEFAKKEWDSDGDGVLDAQQHNTYDIEFYGLQSLGNVLYFAALKAVSKMAEYLGDSAKAEETGRLAREGAEKMDRLLYNGEYYRQTVPEGIDAYRYQYGEGCLSDQLLGQELAYLYGLGCLLPEEHAKSAAYAIYKYNFKEEMGEHYSLQRGYAYQDEPGLLLCSWPQGGRPLLPFVYSDEVWTGIEYQVAVNLIYEGYLKESLDIVRAVRKRYDGKRRSPFNEVECGNHYARSMASWGLLNALSGLSVDLPHGSVTFDPKVNRENFRGFYSTGNEWGELVQTIDGNGNVHQEINALYTKGESHVTQ